MLFFENTVPVGYSNLGYSARAAYSDLNPPQGPQSVTTKIATLAITISKFSPFVANSDQCWLL